MKKVLLIKLSSLGDVIFNIPLANNLKANGYEVHWLTTEKGIDIIEQNPCSDKTFFLPLYTMRKNFKFQNFFKIIQLILDLRRERYDIAFDCQRRIKSLPFMLLCGAKRRIISDYTKEFARYGANEIVPRERKKYHMVNLNLLYAKYLGLDTDNIIFSLPKQSLKVQNKISKLLSNIDISKPLVIIAPATTWETKHWDIKNWISVIENLKNKCNLIFTGTKQDKELISKIGGDKHINIAGKTNLKDLIELYSRANLVIAPDSGSAHLAWAASKPALIEIFCATDIKFFGCFGDDNKYYTLSGELPCQPCTKRHCKNRNSYNACTKLPEPEQVIELANKILQNL